MSARQDPVPLEINAAGIPAPRGPFSHAVRGGQTLFVSGLLALGAGGDIVAPGDAGAQAERILGSLDEILDAAGSSREHVVKLTVFLTDLSDRAAVSEARGNFFGDRRPASTLVEVAGLAAAGARVEIEAIAMCE
jgi:2-iminobutanoate/2-iminopropanoate deaminase